ncbi:unnamed protein product [Ixodes pacificus]
MTMTGHIEMFVVCTATHHFVYRVFAQDGCLLVSTSFPQIKMDTAEGTTHRHSSKVNYNIGATRMPKGISPARPVVQPTTSESKAELDLASRSTIKVVASMNLLTQFCMQLSVFASILALGLSTQMSQHFSVSSCTRCW